MEVILGCLSLTVFGIIAAIAESRSNVATKTLTRSISTSNLRQRFKGRRFTSSRVWDKNRAK